MPRKSPRFTAGSLIGMVALLSPASAVAQPISPAETRAIAKEAYIYGFPLVDSYRVQYSYFVDRSSPEFKAPWNTLYNTARLYTPDDKAIQTPNSDTPYSFVGADLRAEPLVFTVPAIEKERYYSLQFIDMYTFNFAYVGSRATGNDAGKFLLAGPGWKGDTPSDVKSVIRSETEFAFVLFRTQLFNPADIDNVKQIQAGYKVEPLSQFLGKTAPTAPPAIDFIKPLSAADEKTSPELFNILDFVLQFCPTHPSERELMARFAKLSLGAHGAFDAKVLSPELRTAVQQGMEDAWNTFKEFKKTQVDTGKHSSADAFGTREYLNGNYLERMSAAVLGIYGNSKDEAIYPVYFVDDGKKPLSGANRYSLRFAPGQLPPVNAFWSLTLYELPSSLLSANRLNRYLINSPMLPDLNRDADGGRDALRPARHARRGQGGYLATGAKRTLLHGAAALLAQARSPRWTVGGVPASHRELNRQGSRTMKASSLVISIALSGTVAVVGQAHAQSPSGDPISVTVDNFIRAESDLYLGNITKDGGFGKFNHRREPATIENQTVIRLNRDTLYSAAVFDLDAGPVTITLPDTGNGFMSMQVIDEDHCEPAVFYGAGSHTLTRDQIGTRYMAVAIRTLVDPADPKDIGEVHALQDAIKVSRKSPGKFEIPNWDPASQKKLRDALLVLGSTLPDFRKAFGTKEQVDPIRHLIGSAAAWGGNPRQGCDLSQHHPR